MWGSFNLNVKIDEVSDKILMRLAEDWVTFLVHQKQRCRHSYLRIMRLAEKSHFQ